MQVKFPVESFRFALYSSGVVHPYGTDANKLWRQLNNRDLGLTELTNKPVKLKTTNTPAYLLQSQIKQLQSRGLMDHINHMLKKSIELCGLDKLEPEQITCLCLYPPRDKSRSSVVNPKVIRDLIHLHFPQLIRCEIKFCKYQQGAIAIFLHALAKWQQSDKEYFVFGGIDCLVTIETQDEARDHCERYGCDEVNPPTLGEASAFVVLSKSQPQLQLYGAGAIQQYTLKKAWPICAPFTWLLQQANILAQAVSSVYLPHHDSVAEHMHWYELSRRLWPTADKQKRKINAPKVLHKEMLLGDIGAASFPLMLLLTLERMKKSSLEAIPMIVELNEYATQGVLVMKPVKQPKEVYANRRLIQAEA